MDSHFFALADRVHRFIEAPLAADSTLETQFNTLAHELCELQRAHNEPFRTWCRTRSFAHVDSTDWRTLPALPTSAFKEFAVSCLSPHERTEVFHSSGTTSEQTSRHFHHAASLKLYETSIRAGLASQLPTAEGQLLVLALTPPPTAAPHSSLAYMLDVAIRTWGSLDSGFLGRTTTEGWEVDTQQLRQRLDRACLDGQPVLVCGTAFNYVHVLDADAILPTPKPLPPGSRIMETGGYKGRSRELPRAVLHQELAQHWGLPARAIFTEYGMSELSSQAYSIDSSPDGVGTTFHFPHWARARVVSPETGREVAEGATGVLCVTDLANVWSVLAVQTADLAVRRGANFELLGRAPRAEARGCSLLSVGRP